MPSRYETLPRDELIRILERRDARRPYGLVWERDGLTPDQAENEDYVVLDLDPALSTPPQDGQGWRNLVIEGDNWDALRALRLAYAGRVRCILIDPPYNTGNRDFAYNDSFVGREDRFRHSLWLEFLYKRLVLARDLLADDGVILVCINDENRARLDLLMEQVFPGMRVGSFVWRTRTTADVGGRRLSIDHEHILAFANVGFSFGGTEKDLSYYSNPDNDVRGDWYPGDLTKAHSHLERPNAYFPIQDPSTGVWFPCNPERVWAYASAERTRAWQNLRAKTIDQLIAEGRVIFPRGNRVTMWSTIEELLDAIHRRDVPQGANGNLWLREGVPGLEFFVGKSVGWGKPTLKRFAAEVRVRAAPASSWLAPKTESDARETGGGAGYPIREGTKTVQRLLGERAFAYPKPETLMRHLLAQSISDEDIVLDFFAGSGTTAHAVLAQNAEDDGNRRFIMVSNTEATADDPDKNICRDVCAERIRRVIAGYGDVAGLGGDFAYLRTRRIAEADVMYDLDPPALWTLLQLRHGGVLRPYDEQAPVQVAPPREDEPDAPTLAFVPLASEAAIASVRALTGPVALFTPVPGILRDATARPGLAVEAVPDRLLSEFRRSVVGL